MKVYVWTSMRGGQQFRCIMEAASVAAVRRASGLTRAEVEHSLCLTQNDDEIAAALDRPGVVLARRLNHYAGPYLPFTQRADAEAKPERITRPRRADVGPKPEAARKPRPKTPTKAKARKS